MTSEATAPRPFGLLAELTYRCPLHCPYCSNPTHYPAASGELTTEEWQQVIREAAALGVMHLSLSGGEPLLRGDLPALTATAREAGLYTTLITSAVGLTRDRLTCLQEAGLDNVQISFQGHEAVSADAIAGARAHVRKREAAGWVKSVGLPLTVNVVLHRRNIDQVEALIAMAEGMGAERLELASTQFYGWAFQNKLALLPTRAQLRAAAQAIAAAQERISDRMEILFVLPDYYSRYPKPCMNGWGRRYLTVNPVGDVLPCQTAVEIKSLRFDNIRRHSLAWIWAESEAFNCFRGTAWMPEPCQTCERREVDFGGCRCQAALLTGNAANTDPACIRSPNREQLLRIVADAQQQLEPPPLQFRTNPLK